MMTDMMIGPLKTNSHVHLYHRSNRCIGNNGALPWQHRHEKPFKRDMDNFRRTTIGHTVIMGRKTYESIGHALPLRFNIVLSSKTIDDPNVLTCRSLDEALSKAPTSSAFIIGGATLFEQALPLADAICLTVFTEYYNGDTFFPKVDWSQWIPHEHGIHLHPPIADNKPHWYTRK